MQLCKSCQHWIQNEDTWSWRGIIAQLWIYQALALDICRLPAGGEGLILVGLTLVLFIEDVRGR